LLLNGLNLTQPIQLYGFLIKLVLLNWLEVNYNVKNH
jgi:hypothetical protein